MKKITKITDIEDLRVYAFPFKPASGSMRFVRVQGGRRGETIAVTEGGRVYSTEVPQGGRQFMQFADSMDATWRGCVKLGLLSDAVLKKVRADAKEKAAIRGRSYRALALAESARELGIPLTKRQAAKVIEHLGGGRDAPSLARIAQAGLELPQ